MTEHRLYPPHENVLLDPSLQDSPRIRVKKPLYGVEYFDYPLADSRAEMTFPAHHSQHPACLPPSLLVSAIVARPAEASLLADQQKKQPGSYQQGKHASDSFARRRYSDCGVVIAIAAFILLVSQR